MSDYSRKITPICCQAYRVNRVWEEAENRWVNRLTIAPQTFCGLKEIELKTRKIQRKNQQCVTITQSSCSIPYAYFVPYAYGTYHLIQNSQAVKKCAALRKAMVKKDVKSKVAAKKWL